MKAKPSSRAWRDWVWMVLPGARQESLRFTAEKTLSIKERFPYGSVGKCSLICGRTPVALQPERRLAGMMRSALSCRRKKYGCVQNQIRRRPAHSRRACAEMGRVSNPGCRRATAHGPLSISGSCNDCAPKGGNCLQMEAMGMQGFRDLGC